MSALLRSGKFLRLVTGIARQNLAPATPGSSKCPEPSLQGNNENPFSFQTWSLHQLHGALPVLSSSVSQDQLEESDQQVRLKDPLREFLVDQQKISDASDSSGKERKTVEQKQVQTKTGLNKSLKNDVILGFDAIKEEPEPVVATVAVKTIVSARRSPTKEPKLPDADANKEKIETVVQTEAPEFETSGGSLPPNNPPSVPTVPSPLCIESDPSPNLLAEQIYDQNVVARFDHTFAEPPVQAQSFIPMVQVVEEQVTQWYPLHVVCSMFRSQGRVTDLENLLMGSMGIRPDDRKLIFMWTLQAYADLSMYDNAIMLAKRLEWEGLSNDFPEFHALMTSIIQNYSLPPYQTPSLPSSSEATTPYPTCPSTPVSSSQDELVSIQAHYHRRMKKAISKENAQQSLKAFNKLEKFGKQLNVTEMSALIELLVKEDFLQDATSLTELMLRRNTYPMPKIFRFLLNRLASTGQVEMMNQIGRHLSTEVKKEVSYDNRLCNAYLSANRGREYLEALEKEIDEVLASEIGNENKISNLKDKFPRGGAMGILESDPTLVEQYTRLAQKFLKFGFVAPVNVLWTYHFIYGRYDVAMPLWEAHVKNCPQIMFQKVCQTARSTGNAELAWRLVDLLQTATVTQGARGIAYSCLIDVLTQQKSYEEGCEALRSAINSGVQLTDINRTALKRLKDGLESKGITFPYDIPGKVDLTSDCESEMSCTALVACQ